MNIAQALAFLVDSEELKSATLKTTSSDGNVKMTYNAKRVNLNTVSIVLNTVSLNGDVDKAKFSYTIKAISY